MPSEIVKDREHVRNNRSDPPLKIPPEAFVLLKLMVKSPRLKKKHLLLRPLAQSLPKDNGSKHWV